MSRQIQNYDSPLVQAFHEKILPALVSVVCVDKQSGLRKFGTGTVIGRSCTPDGTARPVVVTVGHVLPGNPKLESKFYLRRFRFDDPANPTMRSALCIVEDKSEGNRSPRYIRIQHKTKPFKVDIGMIRGPALCEDGKPWFSTDANRVEAVEVRHPAWWCVEGAEVAWAGYSEIVRQMAQRPQPCFYRGVVSSLLLRDNFQAYFLDGHNAKGISGGPVWSMNIKTNEPEVIGVISSYYSDENDESMPGLVLATPIQTLLLQSPEYRALLDEPSL